MAIADKKRLSVLVVSPFFYPEQISTGKYNTYLVTGMVELGGIVEVICSHPLYPQWRPQYSEGSLPRVNIIRGGRKMFYPSNPLARRLFLELWFLGFVFLQRRLIRKTYDRIVIVFPPNLASLQIPFYKSPGTKVIGVVHDIQGIMANSKQSFFRTAILRVIRRIERRSYLACDRLIFLSEKMKQAATELYSIPRGSSIVRYPFVTVEKYKNEDALESIFSGAGYSLVYSGALGEKQAPDKLIHMLLSVLDREPEAYAFIFSQGAIFDRLSRQYQHERLRFHSLVPEEQLPELIARSTVQIIPQEPGISDGAFPSKLPNILAAGAKLFAVTDKGGELDRILNQYSRASVCYSWNITRLARALIHFMREDTKELTSRDKDLLQMFSLNALVESILR